MKKFLTLTAILEGFTGIALIAIPNSIVLFLLGKPTNGTGGMITAMLTGVAILSLAVICWLLRDTSSQQKLIKGMLFYNCAIISVALYGVLSFVLTGLGLWLMILSHAGFSFWGAATLRAK
jgi:predicted membrane-bound spermidine synthase